MYEENRLKLGIFVLFGTGLMIAFIFFLGLKTALEPKLRFHTMFTESVQGLEVGSPVKFKGVTIGSVADIKILRDTKKIRVDMNVNPNTIDYDPQAKDKVEISDPLTLQIERGLCCQLQMTGITGMKFVEIDYFKDPQPLPKMASSESGFIPPGVSVFQNTVDSASEALNRISKVDFEGISDELHKTIQSVNKLTSSTEIQAAMKEANKALIAINKTISNFNASIEGGALSELVAKLDKTLKSIDTMSQSIRSQVEAADLEGVSKRVQSSLGEMSEVSTETSKMVKEALKGLNGTMSEIKDLVELIEEDPTSLLRGKQKVDRFAK